MADSNSRREDNLRRQVAALRLRLTYPRPSRQIAARLIELQGEYAREWRINGGRLRLVK
jgi:hypothetical protein